MSNGIVIFEDDEKVAILTGIKRPSSNPKTGAMLQLSTIVKAVDPVTAHKTNQDKLICGECIHRKNSSCYVNLGQSVLQMYRAYKNGSYTKLDFNNRAVYIQQLNELGKLALIRLGAYGDCSFIPNFILTELMRYSTGVTGYTHQFFTSEKDTHRAFMISAESKNEALQAHKLNRRTFRVTHDIDDLLDNEIVCPNMNNTKITCSNCLLCDGRKLGKNIVVQVHGVNKNKFKEIPIYKH